MCGKITLRIPFLAASLYVKHHYKDPSVTDDVTEMVKEIRESFKDMIDKVEWMNEGDKKESKDKADAMENQIGYEEQLLKDDELYPHLDIKQNEFFNNVLRIRKNYRDTFSSSKYVLTHKIWNEKLKLFVSMKDSLIHSFIHLIIVCSV